MQWAVWSPRLAIDHRACATAAVAIDANSGSLVVTALPSVHDVLRATMDEYRSHQGEQKQARAYRVSRARTPSGGNGAGYLAAERQDFG